MMNLRVYQTISDVGGELDDIYNSLMYERVKNDDPRMGSWIKCE
jgi:hypothetical protein